MSDEYKALEWILDRGYDVCHKRLSISNISNTRMAKSHKKWQVHQEGSDGYSQLFRIKEDAIKKFLELKNEKNG